MGIEIAGIGLSWWIAGAAVVAGSSVGSSAYTSHQEAKQQKKLLESQEEAVSKAEAKAAAAEALATQEASDKLKRQRLAQTNTILTSPLGVSGEANTGMSKLLGG